jgi:uncharacterized damage-inducible protein DinB
MSTDIDTVSNTLLPLTAVYAGWDAFQTDLLAAVAPLSAEQWALPVAPTHWSIERLVQHIVADRAWWFHLWMGEGGSEVADIVRWEEDGQPQRSATELVSGLEATWDVVKGTLARRTVADLAGSFDPPAALPEAEREFWGQRTRQWIIWHVLRHDIHHGGELAVGMGGYDLPTIWRF